jgi:hypothetical protein
MSPVAEEVYEYSDSEPDVGVQSLGSAFDGLVIAVSGKLSGESHGKWLITSSHDTDTNVLVN